MASRRMATRKLPSFETPRSLSSGAHSRDPLAAPQDEDCMYANTVLSDLNFKQPTRFQIVG